MDWNALPAWGALLLAAGAGWVSWLARSDSKRAADAAVEAVRIQREASMAAVQAVELQREEVAAAIEAVELQRTDLETRRLESAARPVLRVEHSSHWGREYIVRNVGTVAAANVEFKDTRGNVVTKIAIMRPGVGVFIKIGEWGNIYTTVYATWDGQTEPVGLPLPHKKGLF